MSRIKGYDVWVPDWFRDNGCGSGPTARIVPDGVFGPACRRHDFNYMLGGTARDREESDWQFLLDMLTIARRETRSWWLMWKAMLYYRAVRRAGSGAFSRRTERPASLVEARVLYDFERLQDG